MKILFFVHHGFSEHSGISILVKNGDIEGMAKAICQLIENENKRISFGKKAKENISCYLPEKIIPKWNLLFNSLTQK